MPRCRTLWLDKPFVNDVCVTARWTPFFRCLLLKFLTDANKDLPKRFVISQAVLTVEAQDLGIVGASHG
jgi:hypothetical protein